MRADVSRRGIGIRDAALYQNFRIEVGVTANIYGDYPWTERVL